MLHTLCHTLLFEPLNLLPHLPLSGGPYYLPVPWVPLSWAPSVVLAALTAGRSGCPSPWTAPPMGSIVSRFWWFWWLVALIAHIHRSTQGTDFMLGQSVVLRLVLCRKTQEADVTTIGAMDTLVVFSKLTYAVTSELA